MLLLPRWIDPNASPKNWKDLNAKSRTKTKPRAELIVSA